MQLVSKHTLGAIDRTPRFDSALLKILRKAYEHANAQRRAACERRRTFLRQIAEFAEDGEIAIVWSGRDCDGSQYENSVNVVPATKAEVEASIDSTYHWADGPCYYYLMRPSEARELEYQSRDLALEAFEDGHNHIIYG